ncbi:MULTISPECIES: hypothetical protein [Bradyrhizobium]|uniref:hypothetical protein n=1 Tax=Bradyrhizobium TaxID=374 RepID=UPI0004B063BF|nr:MULTISPECIES: hypothetical protein [unclassified Bradyrhizobium]MDA9420653.1 hypothetical protein [Bradyrhizobium sp. CCBAU 53380]
MSTANTVYDEHEGRVATITTIAIEAKAVIRSESEAEITPTNDQDAEKLVYARAFQAWAEGRIGGNAEDIFETVQEVLEI